MAAVIDPCRDSRVYMEMANRYSARITYIFETRYNKNSIAIAPELAKHSQAEILHGNSPSFKYGKNIRDSSRFALGNLSLETLETPGYMPESISIALSDRVSTRKTMAVFTGNTLLDGATGQPDLYPTLREELAGMLYDSIHKKLFPLGDHVIFYPASRSRKRGVREFSTLGQERQFNPMMKKSRKDFILAQLAERNAPCLRSAEKGPTPEKAERFSATMQTNSLILDVRNPESFIEAHIPGSLFIPLDKLPLMAGWLLPYGLKIGLVAERVEDVARAHLFLMRMGYDNATCSLAGGLRAWCAAGMPSASIPLVSSSALDKEKAFLLDVRSPMEHDEISFMASRRIWIGNLPQHSGNLPRDRRIITFCNSGWRAITAASLLKQTAFYTVAACTGE